MLVAFMIGAAHYDATQCVGSGGDCDLGGLEGLAWTVAALAVAVLAVITVELVRYRRHRVGDR